MRKFTVRQLFLMRGRQQRVFSGVLALALIGFIVPTFVPSPALAANQLQVRLGPNGEVEDLTAADANGIRYMGGRFTAFNAVESGNAALIDGATAEVDMTMPKITGTSVKTIISDGNGGYYIGGVFTKVGSVTLRNAAHINSDGTVDAVWNPSPNLEVNSLLLVGSTVYMGGSFTNVGGLTRNFLAAMTTSGAMTTWAPLVSGSTPFVKAMIEISGTIYFVGKFTSVESTSRTGAAAVNTSGTLQSWNPGLDQWAYAIVTDGTTIYLGGTFGSAGGSTARKGLAAFDTAGTLQAWNPNTATSVTVNALALSGSNIYVGGFFTSIGGSARKNLAAFTTTGAGTLGSWAPSPDGEIYALAVDGNNIYLAGSFRNVDTSIRMGLAKIDTSGVVQSWDALASATSGYALTISSTNIFVGGNFQTVGGVARKGLAAIGSDNALTTWTPAASSYVRSVVLSGTTVYVGGDFTTIEGVVRNRLAAIDTAGTLLSWNPSAGNEIMAMELSGNTMYIGGRFSTVAGVSRTQIAALDVTATASALSTFNVALTAAFISTIAVSSDTVYFGGSMTMAGGSARNNVAAVDFSGVLQSWNPNANSTVYALAESNGIIYVGGSFSAIGGTARNSAAAFDTSGAITAWNPSTSLVYAIAVNGTHVVLGGFFTVISGASRRGVAVVETDGTLNTVNPLVVNSTGVGVTVNAIVAEANSAYFVGDFTHVGGIALPATGALNYNGTLNQWNVTVSATTTTTSPPNPQTITFASLPDRVYGVSPFTVSASATSSLAVTFSSTTPSVCTIATATVTVVNIGTCTVQADQAGQVAATTWLPAPSVSRSFTITTKPLTMTGAIGVARDYNGLLTATVNFSAAQLSGIKSPDNVSFSTSSYSANFTNAAAGASRSISVSGITLTGTEASRYTLTQPTVSATINTVPASILLNLVSMNVGSSISHTHSASGFVGSDAIASMTYTYQGTGSTSYNASTTAPTAVGTYSVTPSAVVLSPGSASSYVVTYTGSTLTIIGAPTTTIAAPTTTSIAPTTTTTTTTTTIPVDDGESAVGGNVSLNQSPGIVNVTTTFGFLLTNTGALVPQIKMRLYIGPINLKLSSTYKVGGKKKTYKCTYKTFGSTKKRPQVWTTYSPKSKCVIPAALLSEVRAGRAVLKATGKITRFWSLNKSPKRPDGSKINSRLINITIKN